MSNKKTNPLIVFVHVPKTAGSSVNAFLERSGKVGASHIESWIEDDSKLRAQVASLDWVSGHVPFTRMRARLASATARHFRFFTVVRDPVKQLMSHYNWLIEIYHRGGNFYDRHPEHIKRISESIRSADNNNPASVAEQILAAPGMFLNQQSRVVFGEFPYTKSREEILERIMVYEDISTEQNIAGFVKRISGIEYESDRRENVSSYHFDQSVFQSETMKAFIEEHHSIDLALYRALA